MNISPAKENILKKIRLALAHPTPMPFAQAERPAQVLPPPPEELAVEFAQQFTGLLGKFIFCQTEQECALHLQQLLTAKGWTQCYSHETALVDRLRRHGLALECWPSLVDCQAALTRCECLISRTGSIVLSSALAQGRTASVYAPVHLCIAYADQLVYDVKDALQRLREKYGEHWPSLVTLATGPSRTADIEKTLVVGVHGPGEVYLLLIDAPAPSA